jgi:CheY-like chemotaxis protein
LTAQLLAFSRQGKYLSTPVDLHEIIFEVTNILGHSIDKRISIRQELNADPSTTIGDPTQLQSAVLNLALNSRDAMQTGGELVFATKVIELDETYCESNPYEMAPGMYVQVLVSDSGTGMDEGTISRIFEPFFTTKEQGKGTGMGLAAVYGTIKNHRGAIDVDSAVGRGTDFRIYLPMVTGKATTGVGALSVPPTVRGTVHVLLVEDEDMVRDVAAEMLSRLSCRVTVCRDGAQAVDLYRESWRDIDLVILDMVMPVMDGRDAFIAMREINPDIIALLASGYSLSGEAQTIIDEGVKGFIQKPFRRSELLYKISGVLKPSQ